MQQIAAFKYGHYHSNDYICHSRRSSRPKYRVVTIRHVKSRYSANVAPFSGTLQDAGMPFPHAFHSHFRFFFVCFFFMILIMRFIAGMETACKITGTMVRGHLQTIFLKISVIVTLSLGPPPPLLLASWQK